MHCAIGSSICFTNVSDYVCKACISVCVDHQHEGSSTVSKNEHNCVGTKSKMRDRET